MALTREQRERLKNMLGPLIAEQIAETVQNQVTEAIQAHREDTTDYLGQIMNGRDGAPEIGAFSQLLFAFAKAGGDRREAARIASGTGFDPEISKTLSSGDAEGGGVFVPSAISGDFIDLLRPRSVVRAAGPEPVEIDVHNLETPRIDAGATSSWVGETKEIPTSQPKTGSVKMLAKKLATLVPISNNLLRARTSQPFEAVVRSDMLASAATAEDVAFLRGPGTEHSPKGLINWADPANVIAANATVNPTNVVDDLRAVINALTSKDVPLVRPVWIMRPGVRTFLMTLRDGADRFIFRDEIEQGRLFQMPLLTTNNLLGTEGTGNDESKIILTDMGEVILGDANGVIVSTSDSTTFVDPSDGQTKSAFAADVFLLRLIQLVDLVVKHAESVAVLDAVTWETASSAGV